MEENIWEIVHSFRRFVRRGVVPPLNCNCGVEYHWVMGKDDEPEVWCPRCDKQETVGAIRMSNIKEQVRLYGIGI